MKIRKAEEEDVISIQKLLYKSWLTTYPNKDLGITEEDIHEMFKDSFSEENIQRRKKRLRDIDKNNNFYYVDEDEGEIVGVSFMEIKDTNKLRSIYVLPEKEGRGIGSALWQEISKHIDPAKEIIAHVATYNEKAISFYKKIGFVDTGKRFINFRYRF